MTFKGTFGEYPEVGQVFCVKGTVEFDPKRNESYFKLSFCRPQETRTNAGWIDYLMREGPRIGEIRATELVDAFGQEVIKKMAESIDNITTVPSEIIRTPIPREQADKMHQWAKNELRLSSMKAWLYEKGLTYSLVNRIVIKHGLYAPTVVRNEPYSLTNIEGIGFLTADKIAKAVKIAPESPMRIQAALLHQIEEQMNEGGHTCILRHELVEETCKLINVHQILVEKEIDALLSLGKLCDGSSPIERFTQFPWLFEDQVA